MINGTVLKATINSQIIDDEFANFTQANIYAG